MGGFVAGDCGDDDLVERLAVRAKIVVRALFEGCHQLGFLFLRNSSISVSSLSTRPRSMGGWWSPALGTLVSISRSEARASGDGGCGMMPIGRAPSAT